MPSETLNNPRYGRRERVRSRSSSVTLARERPLPPKPRTGVHRAHKVNDALAAAQRAMRSPAAAGHSLSPGGPNRARPSSTKHLD